MCVIVDANCFSHVFNQKDKRHEGFIPLYNWLFNGRGGGLVFGGDKYKKEVDFRTSKYRALFVELERKGRLVEVCGKCVNELSKELLRKVDNSDFDDEHILALVIVSRCRVVCTEEKKAIPFLKDSKLYSDGAEPPKIYRSKRNADLCHKAENIAEVCRSKSDACRRKHETKL